MMRDLRTDAAKARDEQYLRDLTAELERERARREEAVTRTWGDHQLPWEAIEQCPFEAFKYQNILVTDGTRIALASPSQRFGRRMRCTQEPEPVRTDNGIEYVGGKWEEIEGPGWWLKWELTDELGSENFAGGEPTGKDEIDFIPTHWLPMPPGFDE